MKRLLQVWVPWMVLATAAFGQIRNAEVLYTHRADVPVPSFRMEDECFVPVEGLAQFGWTVTRDRAVVRIEAEGRSLTATLRMIQNRSVVAIRPLLRDLGAEASWRPGQDHLEVLSPLRSVRFAAGSVAVDAALEVKPRSFVLTNPNRLIVDLEGAKLSPDTKIDVPDGVRVGQFRPGTVRLVIETKEPLDAPNLGTGRSIGFALPGAETPPGTETIPSEPRAAPETSPEGEAVPAAPETPSTAPTSVLDVNLRMETPSGLEFFVPIPEGTVARLLKPEPEIVEIRFRGRFSLREGLAVGSAFVTDVTSYTEDDDTVLRLTFARAVGVEMTTRQGTAFVRVIKPEVGDGKLTGKVIVLDPGHGGRDSGARRGNVNEKTIVLAVARLLSAELTKQGATVIMTRNTDVFVPLRTRSEIANANKADFFLSIHANSTAGDDRISGTITFHHKGRIEGRVLAESIHAELVKVTGLPDIGVWSDGRIYDSGFSVLRNTRMPGALLELGFVNHRRDRAIMIRPAFQQNVARAIMRGLKRYLGNE
jgi:N-acetylmuramoyl-L-alanine amidase